MTVTIKDVAARAGVSTKTVSRVMNGEAHVRAAVREQVLAAVAALGYRPNAFARSLSSARSYLIGLFFDDPASGYAVAMQRGALARARETHYHVVVEAIDLAAPDWHEELTATLAALRLDGVILAPPLSQNPALIAAVARAGPPCVCISPDPDAPPGTGAVDIDETAAAAAMTARLLALGHTDIGFVEGDRAHASSVARRIGFATAMADAGLAVAPGRIRPGDFSFRSGIEAATALLECPERPSAIFASNDDMALGVAVTALRLGLAVPGTLSIAGFDDAPTSRLAWPPIATVRQPVAEMGAAAVAMVIDRDYRASEARDTFRNRLPYALLERASIGAFGG